jgi:hypothetical protein
VSTRIFSMGLVKPLKSKSGAISLLGTRAKSVKKNVCEPHYKQCLYVLLNIVNDNNLS